MMSRGILVVVSGFSGAGKGTLMKSLLEQYDNYALSVSATTRSPRAGELDGREYFFISKDEFEKMIERGALYEYARYADNYYGTPRQYVDLKLEAGKDVILEIEVQGASKIKQRFPDAVLIFVTPPSIDELKRRLVGRGTEDEATIFKRLSRAKEEGALMASYDYILVNDRLDEAVRELHAIIRAEHSSSRRKHDLIGKLCRELDDL